MKVTLNWLKQYVHFNWKPVWALLACAGLLSSAQAAELKTKNVFLIISDGLRWQEVFTGAEEQLMTKEAGGVHNTNTLRQKFWRETPEARREALMPFFWNEIASSGQIFGNQNKASIVKVSNGKNFSYPGYNEIVTGSADDRIDSNGKNPNPNVSVFEWLNGRRGFQNRVAVFGTWDVFPYIFNVERSHLPIWPAKESRFSRYEIVPPRPVAELHRDTAAIWEGVTYDSFLYHAATDYLKSKKPRVLFIGFGETDEWAHGGRYDQYLTSAHRVDDFIRRLWETVQSSASYRNKTTFIITADHGRGSGPADWKSHGVKFPSSENDWIAVIGPDTPPLGERINSSALTESQIASTIAALLGENYLAAFPKAGKPVSDVISSPER